MVVGDTAVLDDCANIQPLTYGQNAPYALQSLWFQKYVFVRMRKIS